MYSNSKRNRVLKELSVEKITSKTEKRMKHRDGLRDELNSYDDFEFDNSNDSIRSLEYKDESDGEEGDFSEGIQIKSDSEIQTEKLLKKSFFSSENDQWKPVHLITNTCFDKNSGTLLSKEICDANLKKALKSKKSIDYYDVLKSSDSDTSKTIAFILFQLNKIMAKKDDSSTEERKIRSSVFNLEASRDVSDEVFLPGGKRLILSMLIDNVMCSKWVGGNIISKAVVAILDEICNRDMWFLMYAAPATSRVTRYFRIHGDFFEKFAKTLSAGFGSSTESVCMSNLIDNITNITRNYIDKKRGLLKEECSKLYADFVELYQENSMFRKLECPLHDEIRSAESEKNNCTPRRISKCIRKLDTVKEPRIKIFESESPINEYQTSSSKMYDVPSIQVNAKILAKHDIAKVKESPNGTKRKLSNYVKNDIEKTPTKQTLSPYKLNSFDKSQVKSTLRNDLFEDPFAESRDATKPAEHIMNVPPAKHSKHAKSKTSKTPVIQTHKRSARTHKPVKKFSD